jgi:23S rRNA (cytosine1962-C5)-methyltransferase
VDRYGDVLALQITTAGMDRLRDEIVAGLEELLAPRGIVLRNDTPMRGLEGLPQEVAVLAGEVPEKVEIEENGVRFLVSPREGQKTGWFYDQADNRARLRRYLRGGRVLDVCSYLGGWGVQAADWGAEEVLCLDSSQAALDGVVENARLNGCAERVHTLQGDAFDMLKDLVAGEARFDMVLLDPPAFIKRRKDLDRGVEAYRRLNRLGLQLLEPGGMLVTSSCSFHLPRELFLRTVQKAAGRSSHCLQLLESGQQAADHPVHPAIAETAYLKTLFLRAVGGF